VGQSRLVAEGGRLGESVRTTIKSKGVRNRQIVETVIVQNFVNDDNVGDNKDNSVNETVVNAPEEKDPTAPTQADQPPDPLIKPQA